MSPLGTRILQHLQAVQIEREVRADDAELNRRVLALKAYQQARFRLAYADLLGDSRYLAAAEFFLADLYGPDDFSTRDAQFTRIVPTLTHLFPEDIVHTVERLAALHALTEGLDTQMARYLPQAAIRRADYATAWQLTGRPDARAEQIRLTVEIGGALDRFTRNPLMRHSLRMMRGPARAAGLGALQGFLERGFDAFRQMRGAQPFLSAIAAREEALRQRLFAADAADALVRGSLDADDPLGQLP